MATQIVISHKDYIDVDGNFIIPWKDKGNSMPILPDNTHYVIFNDAVGPNEIQTKDPVTHMMTGNTDLNSVSDAVGDTTVQALLDWGTTRSQQIEIAKLQETEDQLNSYALHVDGGGNPDAFIWDKSWEDYDPNYS
tara:strand:+ start:47 stop:454 length:408 start_codon:yes stop_codon:yes gene_type:complete